jgi:hypothetical protein
MARGDSEMKGAVKANLGPRLFQAYCIGLQRSGTTSVAGIFENYRSAHEFQMPEAMQTICDFNAGKIAKSAVRDFILRRDISGRLEMDSSPINHWYMDFLIREYPNAKFIFTIRDCYSWCDSMIRGLMRLRTDNPAHVLWCRSLLGLDVEIFQYEETMLSRCDLLFDKLLSHWALNEGIARRCPPDRSLVVRTTDIADSLPRIAEFIGVSPETLKRDRARSNRSEIKRPVLEKFGRRFLENKFKPFASSDLMREFFPEAGLKDFLRGDAEDHL